MGQHIHPVHGRVSGFTCLMARPSMHAVGHALCWYGFVTLILLRWARQTIHASGAPGMPSRPCPQPCPSGRSNGYKMGHHRLVSCSKDFRKLTCCKHPPGGGIRVSALQSALPHMPASMLS